MLMVMMMMTQAWCYKRAD